MNPRNFKALIEEVLAREEPHLTENQLLMQTLYNFLHSEGYGPFGLDLFFKHLQHGQYKDCVRPQKQDFKTWISEGVGQQGDG